MMDGTVMELVQDSKIHKSAGAVSVKQKLCSFSWEGLTAAEQWKDKCRKAMTDVEKQRHDGMAWAEKCVHYVCIKLSAILDICVSKNLKISFLYS